MKINFPTKYNLVNPVTNAPQKSVRIDGGVLFTGFFKENNDRMSFCSGQKKTAVVRWASTE